VEDPEGVGWRDRDWARPGETEPDDLFAESRFARRRSRTTRAFAIAMLLLFVLIALAGVLRL